MNNHIKTLLLSSLLAGWMIFPSCTDEPLQGGADGGDMVTGEDIEMPFMSFDINLPFMDNTRSGISDSHNNIAGEEWENYIDPRKFRILFFSGTRDEESPYDDPVIPKSFGNKFLFEVNHAHVNIMALKDASLGEMGKGYRIIISEKVLFNQKASEWQTDVEGKAVTSDRINEAVRKAILGEYDETTGEYRGNGFKVVVLANFPNTVEGPREYDAFTGDPIMKYDDVIHAENLHMKFGDDLSELSQCVYDNVYGDRFNQDTSGKDRNIAYKIFPYDDRNDPEFELGGRMGVYTVWVKNFFMNFKEVGEFLRNPKKESGDLQTDADGGLARFFYEVNGNESSGYTFGSFNYSRSFYDNSSENSYTFENVWRVWNFNLDEEEGKAAYNTKNIDVKNYWYLRNRELMLKNLDKSGIQGSISKFDYDGLDVKNTSQISYNGKALKLARTLTGSASQSDQNSIDQGIHLKVYGEGTLRIIATAAGDGKLLVTGKTNGNKQFEVVHPLDDNGAERSKDFSVSPGATIENNPRHEDGSYGWEYIIEPNSFPYVDVYIQAHGGTINIHQIEIIRDRHLYDTGRIGIMPSQKDPIPMYGCQEFDPIGKYIDNMHEATKNGIFNASDAMADFNNVADPTREYWYKRIYLLRSIAKVEVLFKKSVFKDHKPTHLYMRTFNRSARCEPKDVLTPTDVLWYGSQALGNRYTNKYDASRYVGIDQENENIHKYGPLHKKDKYSDSDYADETYLHEYYDKTSWFFGMWTEWKSHRMPHGWDWNRDLTGFDVTLDTSLPFPRVFNTRVDRSDYCRLTYVGDVNQDGTQYMKYVLYVPEKNIDDSDSKGDMSATSKVAHLEMRFEGMNDNYNMDDEHIYRVYMADYNTMPYIRRDKFDDMEKNNTDDFLTKYCYPIIRNHIYRFKINSINAEQIEVGYEVCGADSRNYPGSVSFN